MKILVFNWRDLSHPEAGGAELSLHEQARRWVKKGHKVTWFCGSYKNAKTKETIDGINIIRKGNWWTVYIWAVFYYLFNLSFKYDVILDLENGIPFFTPLFSLKPKVLIIHHVHREVFFKELPFPIYYLPYILEIYLMPLFYRNITSITISESSVKDMIDIGMNKKNINLVYCGINHKEYFPGKTKEKDPTIICLGRIKRYKRLDVLINALPKIIKKVPNVKLKIVGDGDDKEKLEELVKKLNLEKYVKFYGFVSGKKKVELLQRSHVFVTPSSREGWGLVVIEANACKIPAVTFNVPGLNSAIKNKETGFLVKNENELVEKVTYLLKNKKVLNKMSNNALKWSKKFTWDKTAEETLRILNKLINN